MSEPTSFTHQNLFQDGPHLLAALLCERVLEEKDGVKSVIRVTDRITITAAGKEVPTELQPFDYRAQLYLAFKPGNRPKKYNLKIDLVKPNGERDPGPVMSVDLNHPPNIGKDIVAQIQVRVEREGIHWFEIWLDDAMVTKVPLDVVYLIQTRGSTRSDLNGPVM